MSLPPQGLQLHGFARVLQPVWSAIVSLTNWQMASAILADNDCLIWLNKPEDIQIP
jgi:hypothetical protein